MISVFWLYQFFSHLVVDGIEHATHTVLVFRSNCQSQTSVAPSLIGHYARIKPRQSFLKCLAQSFNRFHISTNRYNGSLFLCRFAPFVSVNRCIDDFHNYNFVWKCSRFQGPYTKGLVLI